MGTFPVAIGTVVILDGTDAHLAVVIESLRARQES
jgi:hypothetical protein